MFGFLIGTACLVGLYKVTRGGWGHPGHRGRWGRGRWMLRGLFQRLDTSPGQEKVITESFEALRGAASRFRGEADKLRADLSAALRGETMDHEPLKAAFHRQDALVEALRRELLVSLGKVHEALDPRQRGELAELIESGFRGGHCHSAHRCGPGGDWRETRYAQSL